VNSYLVYQTNATEHIVLLTAVVLVVVVVVVVVVLVVVVMMVVVVKRFLICIRHQKLCKSMQMQSNSSGVRTHASTFHSVLLP
jgi:hypothetical protein